MKLNQRQVDGFLRSPDPEVRAVLVYGPDAGLVAERAQTLVKRVAEDPNDPFRVAELSGAALRADPARLADEAAALALTGGRRAVRVRDGDDALAPLFKDFLSAPPGDALVIVEAGDLPARSALRKAFEAAAQGAAMACYRDDAQSLPKVIGDLLGEHGLEISADARGYLATHLGSDRQVTRRELEKLALYKGGAEGPVELDDVRACIGDSAELTLEDLAFAVGGGDGAAMERVLARALQEGLTPVAVLRAVSRHVQRLHLVGGLLAQGVSYDVAAKRLRPPPFWKTAPRFQAQARGWTPAALAGAMDTLLEAEMACKRTGAPAETLCSRALMRVTRAAPGTQRRAAG